MCGLHPGMIQGHGPMGGPAPMGGPCGPMGGPAPMGGPSIFGAGYGRPMPHYHGIHGSHYGMCPHTREAVSTLGGAATGAVIGGLIGNGPGAIIGGLIGGAFGSAASRPW